MTELNEMVVNTSESVLMARAYGCKEARTFVAGEPKSRPWYLFFMVKGGKRIEGASNETIEAAAEKFIHKMNAGILKSD